MSTERQNCRDGERKTFTFSKTGTLPTLERLLGEMAALEEQTQELEVRIIESAHLFSFLISFLCRIDKTKISFSYEQDTSIGDI